MNILLITDPYPPEIRAISKMMQELAEFLLKKGNSIKVLTSMPQLNLIDSKSKVDLPIYRVENGVNVIRAKIPFKNRKGYVFKALSQILSVPILYKTFKLNNNEEINKRVIYKTKLLENKIQELNEEKDNILSQYDKIKTKCDNIVSENIHIKESRNEDIKSLINTSNESKDNIIESKDEIINYLKNELNNKNTEISNKNNELNDKNNEIKTITETKSSHKIGKVGEIDVLNILQSDTDFSIIDSHNTGHAGDFIIEYDNKKFCFDSKKYNSNVNKKQVTKLLNDISGCHFKFFLALE